MSVRNPLLPLAGVLAALTVPSSAQASELVQLNAYLDLEYRETTFGAPPMDLDGFRQAHATMLFTSRPADDVVLHLRFETAYGGQADSGEADLTGGRSIGTGSFTVHSAYAQWSPFPRLRLRGGRVLMPWGHYNEIHDASPTYSSVHIPFAVYHPALMGGFTPYESAVTGVMATYEGDFLRGSVLVTNGIVEDGNESYRDDNGSRGFTARLDTDPLRPVSGGLTLFYSAVGPEGVTEDLLSAAGTVRTATGQWETTTEAILAKKGDRTELGAYSQIESTHIRRVTPFVRGEMLMPTLGDDPAWVATSGMKVEVSTGHVILKIDHVAMFRPGTAPDGGEVRMAVVGWF